ncbi:Imidazole glycerol phosphate synthase hisHF, chloroplastic [Glycine soja]|nr:Imidazole glycerol phosphate synthase hisHF, chloroplastic [Glycine soja]
MDEAHYFSSDRKFGFSMKNNEAYSSGQGKGFDEDLIKLISDAVSIPVIASSGAGAPQHFSEVFYKTNETVALAAGIFHRKAVLLLFW